MRFCQPHWDALRAKIDERGLSHLVAGSGEIAAEQIADQLDRDEITAANFDPLMSAHFAILNNVLDQIKRGAGSAQASRVFFYLMADDAPEDPVEGYPGLEGRTWPRCPLGYITLVHRATCTDSRCILDRERGFDYMLEGDRRGAGEGGAPWLSANVSPGAYQSPLPTSGSSRFTPLPLKRLASGLERAISFGSAVRSSGAS